MNNSHKRNVLNIHGYRTLLRIYSVLCEAKIIFPETPLWFITQHQQRVLSNPFVVR